MPGRIWWSSTGTVADVSATPAVLGRARDLVQPALRAAVDRLVPELRDPARYHFGWTEADGSPSTASGGKGIRPALAVLSAEAAGLDPAVAVDGAVAVELVHNFSLLHDDIIDGDEQRRHRTTVWRQWSVSDAIIVGDALHTLAFEVLLGDRSAPRVEATHRLAVGTSAMITGQSADMTFASRSDVSFQDCLTMEANKTGALLAFSSSVGAVLGGADQATIDALASFGASLGICFQAIDDLLGIWGDPAVTGKAAGNDLRERKRSMPVAAALESESPGSAAIAGLLQSDHDLDEAEVSELAALVDACGGRQRTRDVAQQQRAAAQLALDAAPIAPAARAELLELADFVADRSF